ncbi:MAG: hypothetical protein AAF625_03605, partial [Pseudomonadota bacterium]
MNIFLYQFSKLLVDPIKRANLGTAIKLFDTSCLALASGEPELNWTFLVLPFSVFGRSRHTCGVNLSEPIKTGHALPHQNFN